MGEEWPRIRVPRALARIIGKLDGKGPDARQAIEALVSMRETIAWQLARIEQLEDAFRENGGQVPAIRCFACQSRQVELEERGRQRRYTCQECGYAWRFGVRED
jgi:hypothetical protein